MNFHDKWYGPGNATRVVTGDIDVGQTKQWINKYFAEIKGSPKAPDLEKQPVMLAATKRASYEDRLANAPQLTMTFPTVVEEKKLAPAGGGGGGRFGGGSSVSANQRSREVAGALQVTVRPFPNVKLGDVESAIDVAFARFEEDGFTVEDVER